MTIFDGLVREHERDLFRLGLPVGPMRSDVRKRVFSFLRGGKGFRADPKETRVDASGKTRGERRRETYARLFLNPEKETNHE